MAETGRTDSVFGLWALAGLQIWAKKQESREMEAVAAFSNIGTDNRSGIVQYYGKLKKRSRCRCWNAGKNTCGRSRLTWYFQSDSGLSYLRRGQSECRTAKRRGKRRYCAASCHLERKRGDHRTEPVCKRDYSRRRI